MKIHSSITEARVIEAVKRDQNLGFCVRCGVEIDEVEPDAEKYRCELCGKTTVYGAEQLLFYLVD